MLSSLSPLAFGPPLCLQVTNGKNAMPAFGGRLSDDDIKAVAAYVIDTAKAGWD